MCGRTALTASPEELREVFGLSEVHWIGAHYNVPPSSPLGVVRAMASPAYPKPRRLDPLVWGLVPSWSKDRKAPKPLSLARVETAATSPLFRDALRRRRCLVAVSGFFEWKRHGKGKGASEPFYVHRPDGAPFALAALWERWASRDGEVLETCAILTQPARPPVDGIHDRMPLVLPQDGWDAWLDPDVTDDDRIRRFLAPQAPDLVAYPVASRVNDPRNDDPACLAPATKRPEQQALF